MNRMRRNEYTLVEEFTLYLDSLRDKWYDIRATCRKSNFNTLSELQGMVVEMCPFCYESCRRARDEYGINASYNYTRICSDGDAFACKHYCGIDRELCGDESSLVHISFDDFAEIDEICEYVEVVVEIMEANLRTLERLLLEGLPCRN